MIYNNEMTQLEIVEFNLQLLENKLFNIKDEHTLYKLLPHYVKQVDNSNILFFNKYHEVLLDLDNTTSLLTEETNEEYYMKYKNFNYLFIETELANNLIYFYNSFETILDKKYHKDYIKRVRYFIELITKNGCIKEEDMIYFRLKINYY